MVQMVKYAMITFFNGHVIKGYYYRVNRLFFQQTALAHYSVMGFNLSSSVLDYNFI